jgi:hypothetical protein
MSTALAEHEVKLAEIEEKTDELLGMPDLALPEPSEDQKRRLEATVKHLGSKYHKELREFRTRCWQAEQLGLQRMNLLEAAHLLEGKCYSRIGTWMGWDGRPGEWEVRDPEEHRFEYFYDHRTGRERTDMGQEPVYVSCNGVKRWLGLGGQTLVLHRLPNLQDEIPYAALLKVDQFKELKLFTCFSILAPKEAFRSLSKPQPEPVDPVLVGSIYNLEYQPERLDDPNFVAHYPLAKWI